MARKSAEQTIYSPQSRPDGDYSQHQFSPTELSAIAQLDLHLQTIPPSPESASTREKLVPYIPDQLITDAIKWFAEKKLVRIIKWLGSDNVVILYNLSGAAWFYNDLQAACQEQGLDISPMAHAVRVSRSAGLKQFGDVDQSRGHWVDSEVLKGKVVISLDDIGDSGKTQEYIRRRALRDGAQRVVTVNLVEKIIPNDEKSDVPDYALLLSLFKFLLGRGLDSGTDNAERELAFRELRTIVELIDEELTAEDDPSAIAA